jgi:osmoprotectant transport system substrate-binding protein
VPADGLVVASFDFDESRLLAEIYAQALEGAGVPVRRQLDLGPRELVLPALQQGLVDLVPEYLGSAAVALDGSPVDTADAGALWRHLTAALEPWGVVVLTPAPAQNHNVFVVDDALAEVRGLRSVSDLARSQLTVSVAGPPECPQRWHCLVGLVEVYGVDVDAFVPVQGAGQVLRSLRGGVADVGVLFSTDGVLAEPGLTVLVDDAELNPAEHVVPVLRREAERSYGPVVRHVLEEVSAQLTSSMLQFANWRVSVAGGDPADEARGWLVRRGLVNR